MARDDGPPDRPADAIPSTASIPDSSVPSSVGDATRILARIESGDAAAAEELLPVVYDELRRIAAAKMAREKPGQTLQATALVHEAYLRLAGENRSEPWRGRRQFFAAASEAMRRILVESARRKRTLRRSGGERVEAEIELIEANRPPEEILALHEALDQLAQTDPQKAELVKLRYFGGMTIPEIAKVQGISASSVDRQWAYARAWLHHQITKGDTSP
jgi:RNA polymerase sigma factor (TIGR02999 family)